VIRSFCGGARLSNFRTIDRQTGFLLPPSVDEWLPERHLARFVVEVVDGLDLRAMSGDYRGSGSASYHPSMLLGLLVYGYPTTANATHPRSSVIENLRRRRFRRQDSPPPTTAASHASRPPAANPHSSHPNSALPPRGFLLGRLSIAGPATRMTPARGRRSKPFTEADLQRRLYERAERARKRSSAEGADKFRGPLTTASALA
jgi:hypothetical protein